MANTFLNTEVECESKVTLILNFSADLDTNINQDKTGYRQKIFEIDKHKIYIISYIRRFPDHISDIETITGRVTGITYSEKKANFVNPVIYRSVDKRAPLRLDDRLRPSALTIDCSTEYKHDVRIIDIGDIRDIDLKDTGINLHDYTIGDTIKIEQFDGTIFDECIVRDYYDGADYTSIIIDKVEETDELDELGEPVKVYFRMQINREDIKSIEIIHNVEDFQFGLGDTVEITVNTGEVDEEGNPIFENYPGTIMDLATYDNADRFTVANVFAILLKYRITIGDQVKSITQLFHKNDIVGIMPFEFPYLNPDIVSVADEGYSRSDDPDDIDEEEYNPEVVISPYIEEGQNIEDPDAPSGDEEPQNEEPTGE